MAQLGVSEGFNLLTISNNFVELKRKKNEKYLSHSVLYKKDKTKQRWVAYNRHPHYY
jgi:hypothetical protein